MREDVGVVEHRAEHFVFPHPLTVSARSSTGSTVLAVECRGQEWVRLVSENSSEGEHESMGAQCCKKHGLFAGIATPIGNCHL